MPAFAIIIIIIIIIIAAGNYLCIISHHKNLARPIANRSLVSCAQYVDGINTNPVTLKSRLRVTQGHWKRKHWIDHTLLTVSRVI